MDATGTSTRQAPGPGPDERTPDPAARTDGLPGLSVPPGPAAVVTDVGTRVGAELGAELGKELRESALLLGLALVVVGLAVLLFSTALLLG